MQKVARKAMKSLFQMANGGKEDAKNVKERMEDERSVTRKGWRWIKTVSCENTGELWISKSVSQLLNLQWTVCGRHQEGGGSSLAKQRSRSLIALTQLRSRKVCEKMKKVEDAWKISWRNYQCRNYSQGGSNEESLQEQGRLTDDW